MMQYNPLFGKKKLYQFISLQFSLTEIVKGDETPAEYFLKYHLQYTFDNDFLKFKNFLENLCLKYSEFLTNKYEPLVKRFIENEISEKKGSGSDVESNQISIVEKVIPEITEVTPELPPGFEQIECEASKEEILNYFMILSKEKNRLSDKFYMEAKDIVDFIKKNRACIRVSAFIIERTCLQTHG